MNHEFKEFNESSASVPRPFYHQTLTYIQMSLRPQKVLFKFYLLNIIGAMATLVICPQYGFGPFGGELGFVHQIMAMGPVWCGVFCSVIFFAGGNLLSYFLLNPVQKKWILDHEYSVITPYISILFVIGMVVKNLASGHIHHDVFAFYASWMTGALLFSILFYKIASVLNAKLTPV